MIPEDVQLRAHLKSLPKVGRILLHKVNVDGANINKHILLGFDHIKVDGILKTVPERAVDQGGFLTDLIGVAPTPLPELLGRQLCHRLGPWFGHGRTHLIQLRRRQNT